jgi:GAF domain-containing protein
MPVSERRRVREVRKYHDGPAADNSINGDPGADAILGVESFAASTPNTTLTALVQLIAWRLGMQRAIVSVVDDKAQYFLAEATKSLHLSDATQHEIGDAIWMGCGGGTTRSNALCANTIMTEPEQDQYACFSVEDLSKDERFCRLPYVAGAPNFRYYAGTPLVTSAGIPIGSVFVIDDRPHRHPTKDEVDFLGVMARNVMEYLELRRENKTRERINIM